MGDSDDEYDRRRVRDKFKRERSDYQDRYSGSSRGGREDWPDSRDSSSDWGRNSSSRSGDRGMNNRGGDGRYSNDRYGNQRRDRYGSPGDRSDMSPPMKRVRNPRQDWEERGNYSSSNNFDFPHTGGSFNPLETGIAHSFNSAVAAATFNSNTSNNTHQSVGPTQPPMMTFKQYLGTQDDSVDDMEAVKKYNDYKTDFKKQQIADFFAAHKEEEWFKSKYHPDEFGKRKEETHQALKNRLNVFMELYDKGWVDSVSIDVEKSDSIIRLLDAAVIKLEGGTDLDLKALDAKTDTSNEKSKASDLEVFQVDVEKPPSKKAKKEKPEEGEEGEEGEDAEDAEEGEEGDDEENVKKEEEEDGPKDKKPLIKEEIKDEDSQNIVKEEPAESAESIKNMDENTGEFESKDIKIKQEPSEDMEDGEASMNKELSSEQDQTKEEGEEEDSMNDEKDERKAIKSGQESEEKMDESEESKKELENEPNDDGPKPRPLHLKDSIFLRNIAPNITKAEIEEMCKKHPGFLRVHIADPAPDRKFYRRGWVTFEKLGNIREICLEMLSIKIKECELGAIVNRDLTRRIRSVNGIASHKNVVRADIRNAAKIVFNLDHQRRIWEDQEQEKKDANEPKTKEEVAFGFQSCNPLLKNIADYMIEEASAEEEELLGDQAGEEEGEESPGQSLDRDDNLIKVLDRLLLYLRIVHSVDYYNHSDYPNEDEMPNRIGIMHARGAPPSSKVTSQEINEYIKTFEQKIKPYLQPIVNITDEEALKLGKKEDEKEVEEFIKANIQEIGKDKWLCPLSGKKFKGPDFVRKHILNKHEDRLHQVKKDVEYFNNYLSDPKRPALPEHPSNRPANAQTGANKNDSPSVGHSGPGGANAWAHPAGFPAAPGFPGFPLRTPLPFGNPMAAAWTALSRNYQPMAPNLDYTRGGHQAAAAAHAVAAAAAASISRNRYGARTDPRAVVGYADLDDNLEMI